MSRCLLLAGFILWSVSRAEDTSVPLRLLAYHADLRRVARWPCAFVGDLLVPASGEGAHPFGAETPLRVPVDLRVVTSAAHFDELLLPQFMELCAQVGTQHSTLDCSTAVLQSVHHAAGRVCSGKVAAEPTTISDAENQEGSSSEATLRRHALHSQPPLHNPSHAKSRGEARAITEQDTAAQQPKLLNRLNKVNVNITFAGADSRSSKVLPCNWAEDVVVLTGNVPLMVPMYLSIDARGGAPVKSFAQAFSFLRDNLRATCAQVVAMRAQPQSGTNLEAVHAGHADSSGGSSSNHGSDGNYNVDACVTEIEDGLVAAALEACPSREPLQRSLESYQAVNANIDDVRSSTFFSDRSSRPDGRRLDPTGAVLHVRALAGDELEHYWHFFVGELLPTVSAALQTLRQLPPEVWTTTDDENNSYQCSSTSTSSAGCDSSGGSTKTTICSDQEPSKSLKRPVLTVVVHNPLRPWRASPLHGVYSELTAATNGALVFQPSPYDCSNAEAINDIDEGDGSSTGTGTKIRDTTIGQATRQPKLDESSSEVLSGAQQCRGVAVARLPRWDYEAQGEDLKKLAAAADFLSDLLFMHSKETSTTKASAIYESGVAKLQRIVQNSFEELSSTSEIFFANSRSSSSSTIGGSNVKKPALTMVVQQRSHDAALGSFYSNYFCGLIASGDLPYLSKEGCGRYGSQTRHVAGLRTLASQLNATYADLRVVLTAPDGGTSLAEQATPYVGADLLVLGHGGGMAHALWMHAQQSQSLQAKRRRKTRPAIVLEITSAAKHAECNGAARGLITLAQARNAMVRPANEGCKAHDQPPLLTVRRLVCTDTSAHAIDLLSGSSDSGTSGSSSSNGNLPDGSSQSNGEFSGDVSDVSTPCGALLHSEVNKALLSLRA